MRYAHEQRTIYNAEGVGRGNRREKTGCMRQRSYTGRYATFRKTVRPPWQAGRRNLCVLGKVKEELVMKTTQKRNKLFLAGMFGKAILIIVLAFVLVLTGCGGGGTLTVNNCPKSGSVLICDSDAPATQMEFVGALTDFIAVGTADSGSSYTLRTITSAKFAKSGNFLVIITIGSNNYFQANVRFTNGVATVDFESMTSQESLPF
jgi:hypothetical protein